MLNLINASVELPGNIYPPPPQTHTNQETSKFLHHQLQPTALLHPRDSDAKENTFLDKKGKRVEQEKTRRH